MPPYYTGADFGLMFFKGLLLPVIMVWYSGWINGLALYFAGFVVYYQALKVAFKMERLSALDEFFLLDNPKNRANILTVVKLDKMTNYARLR